MAEVEKKVSKPLRMSMDSYKKMTALMEECKDSNDKGLNAVANSNETAFLSYLVNEGVEAVRAWLKSK